MVLAMFNKGDIAQKLTCPLFDGKEYWVLTGAAMVLYGIKDNTKDIDLGASSEFIDELISKGYNYDFCDDGTRKICFDEFEIFENWIYGSINHIENIPVISLEGLIELKRNLGREKDVTDIALIEDFMKREEML